MCKTLLCDWRKGQMNNQSHFHLYVAFKKLDHSSLDSDRHIVSRSVMAQATSAL